MTDPVADFLTKSREKYGGRPLHWPDLRERFFEEYKTAENDAHREGLLAIREAVLAETVRSGSVDADRMEEFADTVRKEYNLLLISECVVDENIEPALLKRVTQREIAAGRMATDDELAKLADIGVYALSRPQPESIASRLVDSIKRLFGL